MTASKNLDPRIQRTRASLQDALLTLCKKRDLDEVTISEVVEAAGVNRTTFYQHYPDIDTLLADALDCIAEEAHAQLELELPYLDEGGPRELIAKYLGHVYENAALYRKVFSDTGSPVIVARLTDRVSTIAESGLRATKPEALNLPIEIAAASLAGSFVGIVRAWLRMRPLPTADIVTEWALTALGTDELGPATTPRRR